MTDLTIHPIGERALTGSVPVPSDKSIGHRALLFSALCNGKSRVSGFSFSADNVSTADALRAMGVRIETTGKSELTVEGVGLHGLRAPDKVLDCGNSGTTMRLITGILAAQPFASKLVGDHSLMKRPMMRIVGPLRARGARIEGAPHPTRANDITAPLEIAGLREDEYLGPLEYESPVSSAQIKSAILLSGLFAHGATHFKEPSLSRDHTERLLSALGVPLRTVGTMVELDPAGWGGQMPALDIEIVGDISAAAFLLVAAQIVPGSRVVTRAVGTNPTRTGLLEILRDMGAGISVEAQGERAGEPIADIHAWTQPLRAGSIGGETVARAIDEIPIACALAARASGTTTIRDAEELRVKESDRIATMATVLRAFGVRCEELPDGLTIEGKEGPLEPADIDSRGDHRIAMTATVLGLLGRAPTKVRDVDCISTSFPRFVGTLRGLGATLDVT
ncbi:3-phosphoshikimate 1-carboxyvinyltransferase [Pendulispora albinea]|uniref:3-phosphoshikimate 1-carboxyvinyltransferase n=1 Tax=Pendulispora albinea TaxID=2741071 RepID=A0ABZ2M976_9BACT